MQCPKCASPNEEGVKFCSACQAPLASSSPQATTLKVAPGLELLKGAWEIYKANWKKFILLMLVPFLGALPVIAVVLLYAWLAFLESQGYINQGLMVFFQIVLGLLGIVGVFVVVVVYFWAAVAQLFILKGLDENITVREALRRGWGKIWHYFVVGLLVFLAVGAGFLLFIVPGIIWMIMFFFAAYLVVFEDLKGRAALRRSRELVRGFWWTVFARFLVVGILLALLGVILNLPGFLTGLIFKESIIPQIVIQLNSFVASFITSPLVLIAFYLLYRQLKAVKDEEPAGPTR